MDVDVLAELQDSGARVRVRGLVGLVDGFADGDEGWLRLRDAADQLHTFRAPVNVELVDAVDGAKVAGIREQRRAEADVLRVTGRKPGALLEALRREPGFLDALADLVAQRRPLSGKETR